MIAKQTYFLTADRSKAVPEGDKSAQFLLVREGQEISDADAEKYGLSEKADKRIEPDTKPSEHKTQPHSKK